MKIAPYGFSLPERSARENNLFDKLTDAVKGAVAWKTSDRDNQRYSLVCTVVRNQQNELEVRHGITRDHSRCLALLPEPMFHLETECFENGELKKGVIERMMDSFAAARVSTQVHPRRQEPPEYIRHEASRCSRIGFSFPSHTRTLGGGSRSS